MSARTINVKGTVLGVGTPNICKDGRKTMCAILLNEKYGLIRVYPIPAEKSFPVWTIMNMRLTRPTKDSRHESWKIVSFKKDGRITSPSEKRTMLDACVLKSGAVDPIKYQNKKKASIALCKMDLTNFETTIEKKMSTYDNRDPAEDDYITTQQTSEFKPYFSWHSIQGSRHKTHLVGREVYEGMRKMGPQPNSVFANMGLYEDKYDYWMLLGNMNGRRNVWVGVHLHRLKKVKSFQTFLDGSCNNSRYWPYKHQEGQNIKPKETA